MEKEDLGAVDEARAEAPDPADSTDEGSPAAEPDSDERVSRPVPKVVAEASIQLSQTFQSEVHAHRSPSDRPVPKPRSVELSRTFQSEVEQLRKPPAPPRIPPPRVSLSAPPPPPPSGERVRAERLAKRLRERSSQKTPALGSGIPPRPDEAASETSSPPRSAPPPRVAPTPRSAPTPSPGASADSRPTPSKPAPSSPPLPRRVPSQRATLDGVPVPSARPSRTPLVSARSTAPFPVPAIPTVPAPPPEEDPILEPPPLEDEPLEDEPAEIEPAEAASRATLEGPAPTMEEIEEAKREREGTAPSLESPPGVPLELTPTDTARSPTRPQPETLTREEPEAPHTEPLPAFRSELLDSMDPGAAEPSDEVDLKATFISEVIGFEEGGSDPPADEPELSVERRGATDTEGADATDDDDPFGDLSTGTELGGRYRLERVIGRGATGVVFEASHLVIGKRVALKCLYPHYLETPNAVERFFREAKIAATVEHPNVVQVFDGGDAGDTMFLAMELLLGETLGDRLERGPIPVDEAVEMFLKVADGIAAVHAFGVVHRDLKPDNVFLPRPKGDRPVEPKVLDFGVSKLKEPGRKELTSLGTVLGTPYYMAPEQIRNTRDVDASADVYSLGVILYEMIAGELPYEGDSVVDIFEAARDGVRTPLDKLVGDLPAGLSDIVERSMSAAREERYPTARELHAAVQAVATQGTDPERDPPTDPRQTVREPMRSPFARSPGEGPGDAVTPEVVRPDSVPDRDLEQLAQQSDAVLSGRREMKTVELAPSSADEAATIERPELREPPPKRRVGLWIGVLLTVLVISAVIGAAALELLR